jgi:FAD/FMN-containing dehydrogenase
MCAVNQQSALLANLKIIVGSEHVLTGADVRARSTHFWDASPLEALAVVRPASTAETAAVVRTCHAAGQAIVTHGGVTGLVDGNRSNSQDIVLSLERQRDIESIDTIGRTITVQAGAVLQSVQQVANDAGLQFGLDLGARGSCTIGGNLSTNAGGLSVLRYGMAREQVLGLEVVLADGTILSSLNQMLKNNAGYDLKHLFVGSEGTLGIITRAVLRLRASTPAIETALLGFERFDQITQTLACLDQGLGGSLDAFEVLWQPFYELNTRPELVGSTPPPLAPNYPYYAVVEARGADTSRCKALFQATLEMAIENNLIVDAAIAQSSKDRSNIWFVREHIDLALKHDPVFVYDISLPIASMEEYIRKLQACLEDKWPGVVLYVYGHLADSNLHILIAPPAHKELTSEEKMHWQSYSNSLVYEPLKELGGTISAEHGIGLLKKEYLPLSRNREEIQMMNLLKKTLDPQNILNPGKVVSG